MFDRAIIALTLTLAAVSFAVAAVGFLIAALYLALDILASPTIAALVCGAVLLVLAIVVALIARAALAHHQPAYDETSTRRADIAAHIGEILGGAAASSAKERTPQTLLVALAAGFAIGVSPRLRRSLMRLLD